MPARPPGCWLKAARSEWSAWSCGFPPGPMMDARGKRVLEPEFSGFPPAGPCAPSRRVGKGADHARMHVHTRKHSAVPTRSHIQADAKDRVGTAHDRLGDGLRLCQRL